MELLTESEFWGLHDAGLCVFKQKSAKTSISQICAQQKRKLSLITKQTDIVPPILLIFVEEWGNIKRTRYK